MWVTGITNPDKTAQDSLKCRIEIGSTSVVTSGDYERFFTSADKRYHHIIDPVTLMPAEYFSSVTIITENSGLADALSTALFCMPYEDGLELVSNIGGIDVIWIFKDGSTEITDGVIIK
jgi:thiamine biosynthesis lipoprotein